MKVAFNITTCDDDLERFESTEDFLMYSKRFDGIELMHFGQDRNGIIPSTSVVGYHLAGYLSWVDLWRGDLGAVEREFGTLEAAMQHYGGLDRQALLSPIREDLKRAREYGAEYVVYHIQENTIEESFTFDYAKSDEEVVDAAAEFLNELFEDEDGSVALLMENLWEPGLNFRRPEIALRLLEKVEYPNKGIMLDTGHLLHTNFDLATQEEGLAFINSKIDKFDELGITEHIRGIHLHQSLTGEHCKSTMSNLPDFSGMTYQERLWAAYANAFKVDLHLPFTCEGISDMVNRIEPEYLTFEFISSSRSQHKEFIESQWDALKGLNR